MIIAAFGAVRRQGKLTFRSGQLLREMVHKGAHLLFGVDLVGLLHKEALLLIGQSGKICGSFLIGKEGHSKAHGKFS